MPKFTQKFLLFLALWIAIDAKAQLTSEGLFPGESLVTSGGYPALTSYVEGQANKPLVVFLPGMFHLARIGYGIPGTHKKDFVAYWLQQKGYSFLGISYPLENSVYEKTYPEFSIQDWATQSCGVIAQTLQQHKRHQPIIVLAWSMAGALARDLSVECSQQHVDIKAFISLSAVPGNPYIMNKALIDYLEPNSKGLVTLKDIYLQWFSLSLALENKANHHEIIPASLYRRYFLGEIPVNINASMKRYRNGKFIDDANATVVDAGAFDFVNYPWIGLIVNDSRSDLKINSVDPYNWYQIMANRLYAKFLMHQQESLTLKEIAQIQSIMKNLPRDFTRTITGSHFFFVGEKGAKQTVEKMEDLVSQIEKLKHDLQRQHRT